MNKISKIFMGNDHAGLELKQQLISHLQAYNIVDCGSNEITSVDYPDFAKLVVEGVLVDSDNCGILICGTGIGMSIAANRHHQIRAALCHNKEYAELARQHNNANILVLGARFISTEEAIAVTDMFLNTEFLSGKHQRRVEKLEW